MKQCPKCHTSHDKVGTFCSRKCSNSRTWTTADRKKKSDSAKKSSRVMSENKSRITPDSTYSRHKINRCKCGKAITIKHKQICDDCKLTYYKYYRPSCEFTFNVTRYPNWFELDLVEKYGRYSPSNKGNNLNGVSRDHLLSVKDGFRLKVSPEVIRHPANCKLVLHIDNQRKKDKSEITLDELHKRIQLFERHVGRVE